jgi:protein NirF
MRRRDLLRSLLLAGAGSAVPLTVAGAAQCQTRGTGDLGIVVERAAGSVLVVATMARAALGRITGLGDLSHASAVFSRDERFAFVFGRDGGLSKIDLLEMRLANRIVQAGNAIGGAISDDGRLVAVSNYEPGGTKIFDAETLDLVASVPAECGREKPSKTVGLVDAPGRRFVTTLYDGSEIWIIECAADPRAPSVTRFKDIGKLPYDGAITSDGRHYIAGLFGEDGLVHLDLWAEAPKPRRILNGYGRGEQPLPVYKMPHLEGWALMGDRFLLPAVGRNELLAIDAARFVEIGRVAVHGQPVFAVSRPDGRQAWVNFAHPNNDTIQIVDGPSLAVVHELKPGPAVLHMEFTPRGHEVWVSVRDADRVDIYDARSYAKLAELPAQKPSGILFTARAHRIGQ